MALLVLDPSWLPAQENCTYQKNALGDWNDNRTGAGYLKDIFGDWESSDGMQT